MKRNILLASIVVALVGCSSTKPSQHELAAAAMDEYAAECTYRDGQTSAPKWICGYPIPGYEVTQVGYSDAGLEDDAKADALAKLAGQINTHTKNESKRTVHTYGKSSQVAYSSVSRQSSNENLHGTRVLLRQVDPSTQGLHVLVIANLDDFRRVPTTETETSIQE